MLAALLLPRAAAAQHQREWRVAALGTVAPASTAFVGAGVGLTLRARTQVGIGWLLAGGVRDGRAAARGEMLFSLRLVPLRDRGLAPYLAGGLAGVGDERGAQGYITAVAGLALHPGRRRGAFVEAGFGGGLRVAAGLTLRRPAP